MMVKKPYVKPMIIDLSLEGVTGIGATSCAFGGIYNVGACASGFAAGTSCTAGYSYAGACGNGSDPNSIAGSLCAAGNTATASCADGSANTGAQTSCYAGSVAAYQRECSAGGNVGNCAAGSTQAIICNSGNSQPAHAGS